MKKILVTSILFTLFVTASGCGHMMGHKHGGSHAECACEKSGSKSCDDKEGCSTAKKDEKKADGCKECEKGS